MVSKYMRRMVRVRHSFKLLVAVTMYVFATAIFVRMVFLTEYPQFVEGLDFLTDNLLEGGIFAVLMLLIKNGVPQKYVDAVVQWRGSADTSSTTTQDATAA